MKLATFRAAEEAHIGIVDTGKSLVFDLTEAARQSGGANAGFLESMLALIDAGDRGLDEARALHDRLSADDAFQRDLDGLALLPPLPEPRQMRDAMSFPTHIMQARAGRGRDLAKARAAGDAEEVRRIEQRPLGELPEIFRQLPVYYITNRFSIGGPDSIVQWPQYSEVMDYELEFGIVTKGCALNIAAEQARNHIFGFTIFNDFSARDRQRIEMEGRLGPTKGKSFDGGNVLGPWIVTPDEIGDPYDLVASARINGKVVAESSTRNMLHSFEELLAYISEDETIMPGEFLGSGTVGNGCAVENGYFLQDGDTIELEVEKIGILRNKVVRAYAEIARTGKAHALADAVSANGGDQRLAGHEFVFELDIQTIESRLAFLRDRPVEHPDIGAGGKGPLSGSRDDRHPCIGVLLEAPGRLVERVIHGAAERVQLLWAIEGDRDDAAILVIEDLIHACWPPSRFSNRLVL